MLGMALLCGTGGGPRFGKEPNKVLLLNLLEIKAGADRISLVGKSIRKGFLWLAGYVVARASTSDVVCSSVRT